MLLRFVFALLLLSAFTPARAQSPNWPTVEIFLLKSTAPKVPHAGFFQPTAALLADTAFLSDADISGYVISGTGRQRRYSFLVSSSGQQKFKQLQGPRIPLDGGQPFAVVLNEQPLFGGYF